MATYTNTSKNAMLDGLRGALVNGTFRIYTTGGSASGTLLVTINLGGTPFNAASGGSISLATALSGTAGASGTAAVAEAFNSGGTQLMTGITVGTSSAEAIIASTTVASGTTITLNSWTINQ